MNGADRLGRDPAMRWIVGGKAVFRQAASASPMGRFETELLASTDNLTAFQDLWGRWIDAVHARRPVNAILLDMDSSVSPTQYDQEGSAQNGHFSFTCYHTLFVFKQLGNLERCTLRPGNVHSAFRGNAAFANPALYDYLQAEGFQYAIRLKANQILESTIPHLLKRPVGRPPDGVRRFHASFSYKASSCPKARRVVAKVEWHPGELYFRVGSSSPILREKPVKIGAKVIAHVRYAVFQMAEVAVPRDLMRRILANIADLRRPRRFE